MALTSTLYTFDLTLSDVDRGVYEAVTVPVARHPSEALPYLVTRVLAFALEYQEGIAFTGGLSNGDEPALWVRDLTGQLRAWIEVGTPDATRLHRASKATDRVAVWCHKGVEVYLKTLSAERVHAPDKVTIIEVPHDLVAWLAERVDRRTELTLSHTEGEVFVTVNGASTSAMLVRHPWPGR